MFNKNFLDELDIEKGAREIVYAAYHFHHFRQDIQEARSFKGYDSGYLPLKRHYVASAKNKFQYYKHCVNNAYYYLGASNKEAIDKLIFKYKYQQQELSVAEMKQIIKK